MRLERDDKTDGFVSRSLLWIDFLMNQTLNRLCPLRFYAPSHSVLYARSNAQNHERRTAPSSVQFDADFIIEVVLYALKHISSNP